MKPLETFIRELKFTARDRALQIWLVVVLCLSAAAAGFGLAEVQQQHNIIQNLYLADQQDRREEAKKLKDWGSAAYYSFHLTYAPPSGFAFAALGQRDLQPWKHRIRMLALEGQIYERDAGNPVFALTGRFDMAFLAAFLLPLILIILLYDLKAAERTAGRQHLLEATAGNTYGLWFARTSIRAGGVLIAFLVPLVIAGIIAGTQVSTLLSATLFLLVYIEFWALLCHLLAAWRKPATVILMSLVGIWLLVTVIIPAGARLAIDKMIPIPSDAEILLTQREAVNDAWDLPRQTTMSAFFERHPQWSDYVAFESAFEWQWYYAFQQVGDQKTEALTRAYRDARLQRAHWANRVSWIAPPALLEQALEALARTDLEAAVRYEDSVRDYHAQLREFYYPKFFHNAPFSRDELEQLPVFVHPDSQ